MRRMLLFAALVAWLAADAMPLGLRTAAWGVAPGNRRAAVEAVFPTLGDKATALDVSDALSEVTDEALAENITDANEYAEFREWAKYTDATAVKASSTAWMSYALGADALIGKEITSNDVHVAGFGVVNDGSALGTTRPASFAFEVAIDGVNIGGGAVNEAVLKENLKKVLGVEGAATLSPGAFSSDNISIVFDAPANGKARFTVTPPADAGNAYFMRVKVK